MGVVIGLVILIFISYKIAALYEIKENAIITDVPKRKILLQYEKEIEVMGSSKLEKNKNVAINLFITDEITDMKSIFIPEGYVYTTQGGEIHRLV